MSKFTPDKAWVSTQLERIKSSQTDAEVIDLRREITGDGSSLSKLLRGLSDMSIEEKRLLGPLANKAKADIAKSIDAKLYELKTAGTVKVADLTLPAPKGATTHNLHPLKQVADELTEYFINQGFEVASGPEIESDWYCFEALKMPPGHPARDMQDTFYLSTGLIPRTHTSSVQVRYMEENKPPIKIIAPGKVFRNEDEDTTHTWEFFQIEGLVVDRGISLADLKGTLFEFIRFLLGPEVKMRLRPNYFPYVEPALEVDVWSPDGNGGGEWLEMLGAGMVDPVVLTNVGIDPDVYSGFAFGIGVDRFAKIKYDIDDIRKLWRPDLEWLRG